MSITEFNEMVMKNSAPLKPFAVSLTHDQEVAKDLFQETLYRALANKNKYSSGTNVKAWLFTIMKNIFINDYRRKAKYKTIVHNYVSTPPYEQVNTTNGGAGSLQSKEITKAIHQLPQIFRTPFLLYFEGYRYQEISESLNEPLGTVKSRIHFARKLLKENISRN
ncbi:MAG TPA: RNA polymerase sigma factor [Chitinophagaceae bacterium]|nr:RNA polymerase sigma factor [Chitinophagaceae bacterium]